MRSHTLYITAERWKDEPLRRKVISDARKYAGANPGVLVVVKREIPVQGERRTYKTSGRYKKLSCLNCGKAYGKHETSQKLCPTTSYWEKVADFKNVSRDAREWE